MPLPGFYRGKESKADLRSYSAATGCRYCRIGKTDPPATPPLLAQLNHVHRLFVERKARETAYLDDWIPLNQVLLRAGWRVPVGQEQAWLDSWIVVAQPTVILPTNENSPTSSSDLN